MVPGNSTAKPIGSETATAVLRKATWRIVPLFVACFVMAYLDRVDVSFAKLQMQSELGFSEAAYGFGASIFFVGYLLFEVPSISLSVMPLRSSVSPTMKASRASRLEERLRPGRRSANSPIFARAVQRVALETPTPNRAAAWRRHAFCRGLRKPGP